MNVIIMSSRVIMYTFVSNKTVCKQDCRAYERKHVIVHLPRFSASTRYLNLELSYFLTDSTDSIKFLVDCSVYDQYPGIRYPAE